MLKVLERDSDSLLIRVPAIYERDIRNLFKRSISRSSANNNTKSTLIKNKNKSMSLIKKNVRVIEEDEATPDEIKVINEFYKSRLTKFDFSDLRSAREVFEEIRLKRK